MHHEFNFTVSIRFKIAFVIKNIVYTEIIDILNKQLLQNNYNDVIHAFI